MLIFQELKLIYFFLKETYYISKINITSTAVFHYVSDIKKIFPKIMIKYAIN